MDKDTQMLERGKAAEHIVCADLILRGYRAYLSDQGLPYDVVIDHDGRLLRVQVKSTLHPKNVNSTKRQKRIAYLWNVRRRGNGGNRRLSNIQCDIIALVALDIKIVAYFPIAECTQTVALIAPGHVLETRISNRGRTRPVDSFPIEKALSNDVKFYRESQRGQLTHCIRGHEYTPKNSYYDSKGYRFCRTCSLTYYRRKKKECQPSLPV